MPDAEADLALLTRAAEAAGDLAMGFFRQDPQTWDKPGDAGPVTEADLACDALLKEMLRGARPDYGWLSEETPDNRDRLASERVFIVDPIDGTRAFVKGEEAWAHSLAIAENGTITAAVVFLPAKNRLYSAGKSLGATRNGTALACTARVDLDGATMLAARPSYDAHHWTGKVPPVSRQYRPSLAYRLSLVAEGRFDAMLTLRDSWEWDIAAGTLILAEAGARVSDRRGAPLVFNNPHPQVPGVVAAGPGLHNAILTELRDATPAP